MKEANIEEKVDLLISGMKIPKKRTRRRAATIATSLFISIVLIAGASLIGFYYKQVATVNIEGGLPNFVTINGNAGWEETIEISVIAGGTDISEPYTITLDQNAPQSITAHIHIDVTENGASIGNNIENGLLVEVIGEGINSQIPLTPGQSVEFTIQVTVDEHINTASTYRYSITMDWNEPPAP